MTQLERLKVRIPEEDDNSLLEELLENAKEIIFAHRFPYLDWPDDVENRYKGLQISIAEELYSKIGASGELVHTENGVTRHWGSESVSKELLMKIIPKCG